MAVPLLLKIGDLVGSGGNGRTTKEEQERQNEKNGRTRIFHYSLLMPGSFRDSAADYSQSSNITRTHGLEQPRAVILALSPGLSPLIIECSGLGPRPDRDHNLCRAPKTVRELPKMFFADKAVFPGARDGKLPQ